MPKVVRMINLKGGVAKGRRRAWSMARFNDRRRLEAVRLTGAAGEAYYRFRGKPLMRSARIQTPYNKP